MTTKDQWISGISFISLVVFEGFVFYGTVFFAMTHLWGVIFLPFAMIFVVGSVALICPYMRTWQEWADNVKKVLKRL